MRTYTNFAVTNGNVFGFGQGRVVSSNVTCAAAAQHLASLHASKRDRDTWRSMKRDESMVMAGAALVIRHLCLAITGPQGLLVRRTSPALVTA